MKRLLLVLFFVCSLAYGQEGWHQLSGSTAITAYPAGACPSQTVISSVAAVSGCPTGLFAYTGGLYDYVSHRMIIWGGGHTDYAGNEIYEVPIVGNLQAYALTVPYVPGNYGSSSPTNETMPDGTPDARHTWGSGTFVPPISETSNRAMGYFFGGSPAVIGGFTDDVWGVNLSGLPRGQRTVASTVWSHLYHPASVTSTWGYSAAYDSVTHSILTLCCSSGSFGNLQQFQLGTNTSKPIASLDFISDGEGWPVPGEMSAINSARRLFFNIKATNTRFIYADISSLTASGPDVLCSGSGCTTTTNIKVETIDTTCQPAFANYNSNIISAGVATDPIYGLFVIYPGHGNTAYLLNPGDPFHRGVVGRDFAVYAGPYGRIDPGKCLAVRVGSTPPDSMVQTGRGGLSEYTPYGRFAYAQDVDAFVYVAGPYQPAWVFKLARTVGQGATNLTCIDKDADGYGVGSGCLGPDADDFDPSVNTTASVVAKYGSVQAFLLRTTNLNGREVYAPLDYVFVSTTGNNGSCVRSPNFATAQSLPCATLLGATSIAAAGTMIVVRGGSYGGVDFHAALSGTSSNPVIFVAYPGEYVDVSADSGGIQHYNNSHLTFDGINCHNALDSGCYSGGTYYGPYPDPTVGVLYTDIVIRNADIGNSHWGIAAFDGIQRMTVEDVNVENVAVGGEHDIYLGSRTNPSQDITVRRSILGHALFTGLQFNGRVSNLTAENIVVFSADLACMSLEQGVNHSFFRNIACINNGRQLIAMADYESTGNCVNEGNTAPPPTGQYGICPYDQTDNVFENISGWIGTNYPTQPVADSDAGNPTGGYPCIQMTDTSATAPHNFGRNTYRNIICQNDSGYAVAGEFLQNLTGAPVLATSIVQYNVFKLGTATKVTPGLLSDAGTSYSFNGLESAYPINSNSNTVADPLYLAANTAWYNAPANFSLRLTDGSPAIHNGTSSGAPATAVDGIARMSDIVSIGAYEGGTGGSGSTGATQSGGGGHVLRGGTIRGGH